VKQTVHMLLIERLALMVVVVFVVILYHKTKQITQSSARKRY